MKTIWRSLVLTVMLCGAGGAALAGDDVAAGLRDRALADSRAWDLLRALTAEIGPRPVGTPAAMRARDWALATLKSLGFRNVHAEAFDKAAWIRGAKSAEIVSPAPQKLAVIGLGTSVPTPPQGIEAEIVVLPTLADLLAAPPGAFVGKIVVVNQPMARTQNGAGYGAAVKARSAASEAARHGAVAYLTRSISTGTLRAPHAGAQHYAADGPEIPAGALGVPDADLLQYLASRGPVRIRLKLLSSTVDAKAWNVSGDIVGSAAPKEVVLTGGHLDSWDPGTGATDDGAGVAITTAAAALIGGLPRHPRRTIRVVMWGSEEQIGSGAAYLAAHQDELSDIVIAGECDAGADRVYALQLPANAMTLDALKPLAAGPRAPRSDDFARCGRARRFRHFRHDEGGCAGVFARPGHEPVFRLPPLGGRHDGGRRSCPAQAERRGMGGDALSACRQPCRFPQHPRAAGAELNPAATGARWARDLVIDLRTTANLAGLGTGDFIWLLAGFLRSAC